MKIAIASDHAGFDLKEHLKIFLTTHGHEVFDFGAHVRDFSDDYPDFVSKVASAVSSDPKDTIGIIIGGSGQGEAMVANRTSNVRAAVFYHFNDKIVRLSREHNDANVISLGARFLSDEEAEAIIRIFLETPFSNDERHIRRLKKF
ncbi:MAG: RpiB/LacA/LacB family sugar-phosphate isomerase [Patescibacteria group bacterium]